MTIVKEKKRVMRVTALILLTGSSIHCSVHDDLLFTQKVETEGSSTSAYQKPDLLTKKIDYDSEKTTTKKLLWIQNGSSSSIQLSYTAVINRKWQTSRFTENLKPGQLHCIGEIQFISNISYRELIEESYGCCCLLSCFSEPKEYTVKFNKRPHYHIFVRLENDCWFGFLDTVCYLQTDALFNQSLLADPSQQLLAKSSYKPKKRVTFLKKK